MARWDGTRFSAHPGFLRTIDERFPETERAIGDSDLRWDAEPTPFEIKQQRAPVMRAFARTIGKPDKLLFYLPAPRLKMDAVRPHGDMVPGQEDRPGPLLQVVEGVPRSWQGVAVGRYRTPGVRLKFAAVKPTSDRVIEQARDAPEWLRRLMATTRLTTRGPRYFHFIVRVVETGGKYGYRGE